MVLDGLDSHALHEGGVVVQLKHREYRGYAWVGGTYSPTTLAKQVGVVSSGEELAQEHPGWLSLK